MHERTLSIRHARGALLTLSKLVCIALIDPIARALSATATRSIVTSLANHCHVSCLGIDTFSFASLTTGVIDATEDLLWLSILNSIVVEVDDGVVGD